jgi:hypothetical protein
MEEELRGPSEASTADEKFRNQKDDRIGAVPFTHPTETARCV